MTVCISNLAERVDPTSPSVSCGEIYSYFQANPDLLCVPVVVRERPIGLIHRHELLVRLADQFGRALYEKKPIVQLMDDRPLLVERSFTLEKLNDLIIATNPNALLKGFIIVDNGIYFGMGTALNLLRMTNESVSARAEELEAARAAEAQASRAKSHFLANMSHELRTPLNAIIGFSEIMAKETLGPIGNGKYGEYTRDILGSARHLLAVINDILDLARIEAGRIDLNEVPFRIDRVIEEAMQVSRVLAINNEIVLTLDTIKALPPVTGDERKITQVLLNLLSNAIKFTPPGGQVRLGTEIDPQGNLKLYVTDTGIGIAPDQLEDVMKPFGQADTDLNRRFEGTGLGLPLSRALVRIHGGELWLESTLGRGTTAQFIIPGWRLNWVESGASATVTQQIAL